MPKPKGPRESRGLLPPGFRVLTGFKDGDTRLYHLKTYKDKLPPAVILKTFDDIVVWGRGRMHEIDMSQFDRDNIRSEFYEYNAKLAETEWKSPD